MSHSVQITLIADQLIEILGKKVNVHDIECIMVNDIGIIMGVTISREGGTPVTITLSDKLTSVMTRAMEICDRRGIDPLEWIAEAIWYKNELEAGSTLDERAQGRANEDQG